MAYAAILLCQIALVYLLASQRGLILADPAAHRLGWTRTWGSDLRDYAYDATVADGALYVTGATFKEGETPEKLLLLRYDANGTLTWNSTYGVGGFSMGRGIVTDGDYLYVAGIRITDAGARSLLIKYDLEGDVVWVREWNPGFDAKASGIAIDAFGNLYVTGYVVKSELVNNAFLLRYDSTGVLKKSSIFPTNGTETAWGLSLGDGVYICGESTLNATALGRTGVANASTILMKVSFDGDLLWRQLYREGADNVANSVIVEREIVVAGYTSYTNGTAKTLLLRYSRDGELLRSTLIGTAFIEDMAWGIEAGGDYTYIVGHTRPLFTDLSDATTLKLGPDGTYLWDETYSDYSIDRARGIAVNGNDIYIVGETYWRTKDMQVLVVKYMSANKALTPAVSRMIQLSPIALGVLLMLVTLLTISGARRRN